MLDYDLDKLVAEKRRRQQLRTNQQGNLEEADKIIKTGKEQRRQGQLAAAKEDINRKGGILYKQAAAFPARIADTLGAGFNLTNNAIEYAAGAPLTSPYESQGPKYARAVDPEGQYDPQTRAERMFEMGIDFLTGAKANTLAKATTGSKTASKYLTPKNSKEWAQVGSAGAGLALGQEAFPDSPTAQIASSLIGSRAPNVASTVANPGRTLADLLKVNPSKAATFQEAGINPRLGDVSDRNLVKSAQNRAENLPGSGYFIEQSGKKANKTIQDRYNKGVTPESSGENIERTLLKDRENKKVYFGKKEAELQKFMPGDNGVAPTNSINAFADKPKLYTLERNKAFNKSNAGKALDELRTIAKPETSEIQTFEGPVKVQTKAYSDIPYNDLRDFRGELDNEISSWNKYGTKELGQMRHMRNKVNQDLDEAWKARGPEAHRAWKDYNSEYSKFAKEQEKVVDKLIANKSATEIFNSVMSNAQVDSRYANKVLSAMSHPEKAAFTRSMIKDMGSNGQNEFNINTLASKFKSLTPESQDIALSSFTPEGRSQFRNTIKAIELMQETGSKAFSSNANTAQLYATTAGLTAAAFYHPFIVGTTFAGNTGAGVLMSSPKFINWLARSRSLSNPADIQKHITGLRTIARTSPEIATAINDYEDELNVPKPESYDLDKLIAEKKRRQQTK